MMENRERVHALSLPRVIALLVHYFVGYMYVYGIVISRITLAIDPNAKMILPSLQIATYVFTIVIALLLAWTVIKQGYNKFKEAPLQNIKLIIGLAVVLLCVNVTLSMVVSLISNSNGSNNQEVIRQASNVVPMITLLSTCIAAPLVEECVFRGGVYGYLRKKTNFIVAIIVSSILFGSIHFVDTLLIGDFSDIIYLFVYAGLGVVLAFSYEKSNSILVPFGIHFLNNAISMIAMLL